MTAPKGSCLLLGGRSGPPGEGRELQEVLGRNGWTVSVRVPGEAVTGAGYDLILAEDPAGTPAETVAAWKRGNALAAALCDGPVGPDRLAPYDLILTGDLARVAGLRTLGKAAHFVPAGEGRAGRRLEILERHFRYRRESQVQVDWSRISYGHAEIGRDQVSDSMTKAWQSEEIPARQRALVQSELREMYLGRVPRVYQTLAEALQPFAREGLPVLEIGCASGYYYEILEYLLNRRLAYEGADYSEALIRMARSLYPGTPFHVADGAALPFADGRFEVAISSCVLLHVPNWLDHVKETARVAGRAVIASRSPVCRRRPTQFLKKFAYGVETVELLFNEGEFLAGFERAGLFPVSLIDVGSNPAEDNYTLTYTFEKRSVAAPAPAGRDRLPELLRRGEAAFAAGDLDAARILFGEASAIDADHPRVLNDLGVLALERGEPEAGLEWLRRSHARNPSDRRSLENLVSVLSAMDRAGEALALLDRHLAAHPADADARRLRDSVAREAGPGAAPGPTPHPS